MCYQLIYPYNEFIFYLFYLFVFLSTQRAPGIRIEAFHGSSKKERARAVHKIQRRSGVILTTYGMVAGPPNVEQLTQDSNGREFVWVRSNTEKIYYI